MTNQSYDTAVIASIVTGRLLTPSFGDMHEAVENLAGAPVWTTGIPSVCDKLVPEILKRCPALGGVDASNVNKENYQDFVANLKATHGDTLSLPTPIVSDVKADPFLGIPEDKPVIGILVGDEENA